MKVKAKKNDGQLPDFSLLPRGSCFRTLNSGHIYMKVSANTRGNAVNINTGDILKIAVGATVERVDGEFIES